MCNCDSKLKHQTIFTAIEVSPPFYSMTSPCNSQFIQTTKFEDILNGSRQLTTAICNVKRMRNGSAERESGFCSLQGTCNGCVLDICKGNQEYSGVPVIVSLGRVEIVV